MPLDPALLHGEDDRAASDRRAWSSKIDHLKNLSWTSLAELSPGLRPISANLSRVFFF